ncbi:MAG: RNA methyltransferase [Ginsengibacter sp.]|jgi:TrmH family RNA methyltransferase
MLTKKIVKYIQSLNLKKFRDAEGAFIAEGPKVVGEFLSSKKFVCNIICAEIDWLLENKTLMIETPSESVFVVDENWLQRISFLKTPNKVVAIFKEIKPSKDIILKNKITIMLDELQDPGNLGTIIRIADWFGIENIICSENCVDCYNPKVVQSTMGSLARVTILYTDLNSFIKNNDEIKIYGAALSGTSIFEIGKIKEGIILIGNESKGIHETLFNSVSKKITIPRFGNAESLNAAVALGIILSHVK